MEKIEGKFNKNLAERHEKFEIEKREFKVQGLYLEGYFCKEKTPYPEKLIFIHGSGLNFRSGIPIAESMSKRGIESFTFSLKGHEKSDLPDDFKNTTLRDYVEDIQKIREFIKKEFSCDFKNQIIFGHSLGASLGLENVKNTEAKAIILLSGGLPSTFYDNPEILSKMPDFSQENIKKLIREANKSQILDKREPKNTKKYLSYYFANNFPSGFDFKSYSNLLDIESQVVRREIYTQPFIVSPADIKCPILVIAPKNDLTCPPFVNRKIADYYHGDYLELETGGHLPMFFEKEWNQAMEKIFDWINKIKEGK